MGLGLDKVKAPDMIGIFRPQPDARSVIEPEAGSFGLFLWDLQPLTAPDALNPVLANLNAPVVQQGRHPPIAIAAIL